MTRNFNLPPGCTLSDINGPEPLICDECGDWFYGERPMEIGDVVRCEEQGCELSGEGCQQTSSRNALERLKMDRLKQMVSRLRIFFARDKSMAMVAEFHRAFGHPVSDWFSVTNEKVNNLRVELIAEETGELEESLMDAESLSDLDCDDMYDEEVKEAITNTFDALLDLQVVLDGAFLALGFHRYKAAGLAEVHRSNMSKLGADGKPIYREDGKILKGPNYTPPDLRKVLGL